MSKAWRLKNPGARRKTPQKNNPEAHRKAKQKWLAKPGNLERQREASRLYYATHREQILAQKKLKKLAGALQPR